MPWQLVQLIMSGATAALSHITTSLGAPALATKVAAIIVPIADRIWPLELVEMTEGQEDNAPTFSKSSREQANGDDADKVTSGMNACATSTRTLNGKVDIVADLLGQALVEVREANKLMSSTGVAIQGLTSTLEGSDVAMKNAGPELIDGAAAVEKVAAQVIASLRDLKKEDQKKIDNAVHGINHLVQHFQLSLQGCMQKFQEVVTQNVSLQASLVVRDRICEKQEANFDSLQEQAEKAMVILEKQAESDALQKVTPKVSSRKDDRHRHHSKSSTMQTPKQDLYPPSAQSSPLSTPKEVTKAVKELAAVVMN